MCDFCEGFNYKCKIFTIKADGICSSISLSLLSPRLCLISVSILSSLILLGLTDLNSKHCQWGLDLLHLLVGFLPHFHHSAMVGCPIAGLLLHPIGPLE